MFSDYVVYFKYLYAASGFFSTNKRGETTICVEAESESGAKERARHQLEADLKQKGCRLVNYSTNVKKM